MDAPSLTGFTPRRILLLQLRQIGDVLLATPAVRLLKARFPLAEIDFLTEKKCAPMLENNPDLARVVLLDKAKLGSIFHSLPWYWRTARQGYDLVVDFQQLPRCRWIVAFSRAPVRLSFTAPWYNRPLFTHTVHLMDGYAAACKASVLRPLGIRWSGEKPRLYLRDEEKAWAGEFLAAQGLAPGDTLVTLDPTHRRSTRKWSAGHYAELIGLAVSARPELKFLILHGPGEQEDAAEVLRGCPRPDRCILPGRVLTLREMAAVINAAALHVGNCSAPRHIAVAVDTPSLAILGSTSNAWTFPGPEHAHKALGLDCQPCNRNTCPAGTEECLSGLAPAMVLPALLDMLERTAPK